jgi:hypothetical protein
MHSVTNAPGVVWGLDLNIPTFKPTSVPTPLESAFAKKVRGGVRVVNFFARAETLRGRP